MKLQSTALVLVTGLISLSLTSFNVRAQSSISQMINTDKEFSAYSVAHTTKDAFLKFLDPAGIEFKGNGEPVNGLALWGKRKIDSTTLQWNPRFADVDISGTFGFTTGPWIYGNTRVADTNNRYGAYTSIWKKNAKGQWKLLVDIGVDDPHVPLYVDSTTYLMEKIKAVPDAVMDTSKLLLIDANFNKSLLTDMRMAYKTSLGSENILNLPGNVLTTATEGIGVALPVRTNITPLRAMLSRRRDLGVVYGCVVSGTKKHNYLRIWRHEDTGWKIIVETLEY